MTVVEEVDSGGGTGGGKDFLLSIECIHYHSPVSLQA